MPILPFIQFQPSSEAYPNHFFYSQKTGGGIMKGDNKTNKLIKLNNYQPRKLIFKYPKMEYKSLVFSDSKHKLTNNKWTIDQYPDNDNNKISTTKETNPYAKVFTLPEMIEAYKDKISYLLGNFFPAVGIGGIVAESDVGKSTLVRQIGLAIAFGEKEVLGFPINTDNNDVIYVALEDTGEDVTECVLDQLKGFGKKEIPSNFTILTEINSPFEAIEWELKQKIVCLVIIDTCNRLLNGKINPSTAVNKAFEKMRSLAEKYKCFFLIVHHPNKSTDKYKPDKNRSSGSVYIINNLRIQFDLIPDPVDSDIIHFCPVKGNKIPRKEKTMSYKLRQGEHRLFYYTGERVLFDEIDQRKQKPSDGNKTKSEVPKKQRGKLSQEATRYIHERLKAGEKQVDLAKEYDVTQGAISQLLKKLNQTK